MELFRDWSRRSPSWLDQDHRLMTEPAGWKSVIDRPDLSIESRAMQGDDNLLFRWRLPLVNAPAEVVFEGFVHRILAYHKEWTREFEGGHVVETLEHGARVLYQRFNPGVPGVKKRDLCSLEVTRDLAPGIKLASFRSVDCMPAQPGYERIDWWGAALSTTLADGQTSELVYLDRENQGGFFPTWLMNRMMPKYLVLQAEEVRRFFASGGPAACRDIRAGGFAAPC